MNQFDKTYPVIAASDLTASDLIPVATSNQPFSYWVRATDLGGGGGPNVDDDVINVVTFEGLSFAAGIQSVNILGYYTIGVGGFPVRRVASQPVHPWKFRSTDRFLPNGSTDPTNGGWWEGYSVDGQHIYIEQFGGLGDGVTDNLAAFNNAKNYIANIGYTHVPTQGPSYTLEFGLGTFYFSDTINVDTPMGLGGVATASGVSGSAASTKIIVEKGRHGILTWAYDGVSHNAGIAYFRDFELTTNYSGFLGPTDASLPPYDGLIIRQHCIVENVSVWNFPRDGVHVGGQFYDENYTGNANANGVVLDTIYVHNNGRHGLLLCSGDGNACSVRKVAAFLNGGYGVFDGSFLGNGHNDHDTADNGNWYGVDVSNKASMVSYGGNVYTLIVVDPNTNVADPVPAAAAVTPPTSGSPWVLFGAGAPGSGKPQWGQCVYNNIVYTVIPGQEAIMWTSQPDTHPAVWSAGGAPVGGVSYISWRNGVLPYQNGGSYCCCSANADFSFNACYSEGSQAPSYMMNAIAKDCIGLTLTKDSTALHMHGGHFPDGIVASAYFNGGFLSEKRRSGDAASQWVAVNGGKIGQSYEGSMLAFSNDDLNWLQFQYNTADKVFTYTGGSNNIFRITDATTVIKFGRVNPQPYTPNIPSLHLGNYGSLFTSANLGGLPSATDLAQSDFVLNQGQSVGLGGKDNGPAAIWGWRWDNVTGDWEQLFIPSGHNFTVATLPALNNANINNSIGARAHVTDATAATYSVGTAVAGTGGGTNVLPVFYNGTAWVYG